MTIRQFTTLGLALMLAAEAAAVSPDVASILQRSQQASLVDWQAAPDYDCLETDKQPDGSSRTYQDLMVDGSPLQLLVAVNGKPLSRSLQAQQQQKLQVAIAHRRAESPSQRANRIAAYQKERERDHLLMTQFVAAFNFHLQGEQKLEGHSVYVIRATPRPGYRPPDYQAKVLTGMEGMLWIDQATFQWVRVEAEVIHPVWIEGPLAQVEPGTEFFLEKTPVDNGIWLPKRFVMKARAKVLALFSHHTGEDETYWGYRKAGSNGLPAPPSAAALPEPKNTR